MPTLAMIVVVRRSGHRKKFTEPVALSSTQPADLPLPRRASRLSFDLLALRARCVEETMGKARLGQAPANRIAAVCALLRVEKICVERVPGISGIAERVICARARGPLATGSDPHPTIHPLETTSGPDAGSSPVRGRHAPPSKALLQRAFIVSKADGRSPFTRSAPALMRGPLGHGFAARGSP